MRVILASFFQGGLPGRILIGTNSPMDTWLVRHMENALEQQNEGSAVIMHMTELEGEVPDDLDLYVNTGHHH